MAVPIVAVLAGILFATSVHRPPRVAACAPTPAGLPDIIREKTQDNARMTGELQRLTTEVDELTHAGAAGRTPRSRAWRAGPRRWSSPPGAPPSGGLRSRWRSTTPLSPDQLPEGFGVDDIVVHQQDVQAVVNAFWAGGAEAMMIQDQRIIATSAIRCVGNTLILQGRVYSPPYRIRAIGDPDRLRDFLRRSPEVQIYQEYVQAVGLGYEVTTHDRLEFPSYAGSITPEYATAVTQP